MHGGTYNAHPVNMAATVATLRELSAGAAYDAIERSGKRLMAGIVEILQRHSIPSQVQGFPGIFHVAFGVTRSIETFRDTLSVDRARYIRLTTALVERGVRALERGAWFLSSHHDDSIIDRTLEIVESACRAIG